MRFSSQIVPITSLIICSLLLTCSSFAQDEIKNDESAGIFNISSKTLFGLQKQYENLQSTIEKQNNKLLDKMLRKEDKLKTAILKTDSAKANQLFTSEISDQYKQLQNSSNLITDKLNKFPLKEYVPGIDSIQTLLNFFLENKTLPLQNIEQLKSLQTQVQSLQASMQQANNIQQYVREREAFLKEKLLNSNVGKQLEGINKEVYYCQQRLTEYKELLNDKNKLKDKVLGIVRELPAFENFWQKNSYLAMLFPLPENYGTAQALAGLQTRTNVQNLINSRMGSISSGDGVGGNFLQQQMEAANTQLNQLKDKINQLGSNSGNGEMTMPDFKPNEEKTKTFLQRLEYGVNLQNQPSNYVLPITTDFALSLGYKIDDKKKIGIGASYKMGWGTSLKDIQLSSQGIGLRSYVEIKAKGSFWLSGGFEYNYLSSFRNLQELQKNVDIWQRSALIGISKKYKIGKKRDGNMQVLYDLLHNTQNPPGQALKFRIGWGF